MSTKGAAGAAFAAVMIVALSIIPASAEAARLGPSLNSPPNWNNDCQYAPSGIGPFYTGATSCTYVSAFMQAPSGGGVVTQVRVRTGPSTGPMRMTVGRAIGTPQSGIGCCFPAGESQTFTPRANGTSTVNVRVPVDAYTDGVNEVQVVDYMGLSVLRAGTAVPGIANAGNTTLGFFPKIRSGDQDGRHGGGYDFLPLFNVEVQRLCGAGRTARGGGRCVGGVTPRSGGFSSSQASVPVFCNLTSTCRGSLTLKSKGSGQKLGKSSLRVKPGARKTVRVKLNSAGRRVVRGKRKLTVKVTGKVKGGPKHRGKVKLTR